MKMNEIDKPLSRQDTMRGLRSIKGHRDLRFHTGTDGRNFEDGEVVRAVAVRADVTVFTHTHKKTDPQSIVMENNVPCVVSQTDIVSWAVRNVKTAKK